MKTGDKEENNKNDYSSDFFKEIAAKFTTYIQTNINTSAAIVFDKGIIELSKKDEFDTLLKKSIDYLVEKKLIDRYSIYSLYIQGCEKLTLYIIAKLSYFDKGTIALSFDVR